MARGAAFDSLVSGERVRASIEADDVVTVTLPDGRVLPASPSPTETVVLLVEAAILSLVATVTLTYWALADQRRSGWWHPAPVHANWEWLGAVPRQWRPAVRVLMAAYLGSLAGLLPWLIFGIPIPLGAILGAVIGFLVGLRRPGAGSA